MSSEGARDFVDALNSHQQEHLQAALNELREDGKGMVAGGDNVNEGTRAKEDGIKVEVKPPTWVQLRLCKYMNMW